MRLIHYFHKLYSWILPYTCVLCRYPSTRSLDLCEPCLSELPILPHSCPRCAQPLLLDHLCGECLKQPPPHDVAFALFSYEQCVKRLILNLKFNAALLNATLLGKLLAEKIRLTWYAQSALPDLIIPIPLHAKRIKERGFNQALEIARPVSKQLNIPLDPHACIRLRHTAAQAQLSAEERKANIKNAFFIKRDLAGQHIAVIDDVITTGHTMAEFTKTLKKAGAGRIDVWCCARAIVRL